MRSRKSVELQQQFEKKVRLIGIIIFFAFFLVGLGYFISSFRITQLNIGIFGSWLVINLFFNYQGYKRFFYFKFCTFFIYLCICVFLFFFAVEIANVLSTEDWLFTHMNDPSPCGQSSCTRSQGISCPDSTMSCAFNANGYFTGLPNPKAVLERCYFPNCRWADSNGINTIGSYNQDLSIAGAGNYAGNQPKDYPNKAVGLANGFFFGFSLATDVELCPGTVATLNSQNIIGTGRAICTYCSWALAPVSDAAFCNKPDGSLSMCFLCPGYYESDPMDEVSWKVLSIWFFAWCWIFVFHIICL